MKYWNRNIKVEVLLRNRDKKRDRSNNKNNNKRNNCNTVVYMAYISFCKFTLIAWNQLKKKRKLKQAN